MKARNHRYVAMAGAFALALVAGACQSATAGSMQGRTVAGPESSSATASYDQTYADQERSTAGHAVVQREGRSYSTQNEYEEEPVAALEPQTQARVSAGSGEHRE